MAFLRRMSILSVGVVVVGLGGATSTAEGQYFGRNKVQYESFKFEVLKTDHFDIYYYPEEQTAVEHAAIMAERWYARLSRILNHELSNRQPLILYASGAHFRQTNTIQGDLGEATGGVTEVFKRRIVLPFAGPLAETDHVLGHELVHAFQYDITGAGGGVALAGIPGIMRFPLWYVEGMAEYLSLGPKDANTAMWMRDAVREELPTIEKLSNPRFFPYRYGQSLWAYIAGRWGDEVVGRILKASRRTNNLELAFRRVLRVPADTIIADWHRALRSAYLPLVEQTSKPDEYGRALITPETQGGFLNVGPALSPDGKQVVFLSERDLFSIDMFLADVESGKVIRKITKTDVDPHFESIQFVNSAGSWDFEGKQFVFAAVAKGRPLLSIYDMERHRVTREIKLPDIDEVLNPAWSPDGRYIVFSGKVGGLSDLFVYDLYDEQLNRLTNDSYGELQPVWSPDGSSIAFVTDRFSSGLASYLHGNYRIGLIDPVTGAIEAALIFEEGKHINPQWSPDGASLYFVSDQNGIANVYRAEQASGEIFQVTNLYTGVSGITGLSPALSVAAETGEIAMSVYLEDKYSIYLLQESQVLAGGPVLPAFEEMNPGQLPPEFRLTTEVTGMLENAFFGLPDNASQYPSDRYKAGLSLDYIAQPTLAIGADRFGTYIAGGAALFWSDMLGGHQLATALQVQGSLKDISAIVAYTNLNKRLNWGASIQQIPFRSGFFQRGLALDPDSSVVFVEDLVLFRQTNRQAVGVFAYPLSRVQRLEFTAGVRNIDFSQEIQRAIFDANTGFFLGDTTINIPGEDALNMVQGGLALVYDNSLFGLTGPILGQRYRAEIGGSYGSLSFYNVLADYRKYIMPVRPFTLAARIMHFGRYGKDAESPRFSPLFIGYDGLVRGYNFDSFDFRSTSVGGECESPVECTVFDQLTGAKMIVANLELRFPLLGTLGFGSGLFGFLPIDMIVFGDAGMAWLGDDNFSTPLLNDRPFWAGGDRRPVFSAGAGLRMNVFGVAIIGLDWVYPFSRPNKGGHFQFTWTPGF